MNGFGNRSVVTYNQVNVGPPKPVKEDVRHAMDLAKALADLREQREHLDQAILSLERLASGRPRGRGRPPGRRTVPSKKRVPIPAVHTGEQQVKQP